MAYGVIYIAHNARDGKDIYKVGKTERHVQQRMRELTSVTAVLGAYEAVATFVVFDISAAEQACHTALQNHRIQGNREFFELPLEKLLPIVQHSVVPFAARDSLPSALCDARPLEADAGTKVISAAEANGIETFEAIETMIDWVERLEVEISSIEDDMSEERLEWNSTFDSAYERARDLLAFIDGGKDWGRPDGSNFYVLPTPPIELVSVLFCAPQKETPLELWVTEKESNLPQANSRSRELFFGELIVEPSGTECPDAAKNTVRWKMLDDGRFGRVTVSVHVDKNVLTGGRWKRGRPSAIVRISAEELKYNDSLETFEGMRADEDFVDLDVAAAQFVAIVNDNYRHATSDIRVVTGEHADSTGRSKLRVSDTGVFRFRLS